MSMFFCQPKWTSFYHIYIVTAWILQNLESRHWHIKLKHFLTCIVCIKNALFDDNVNALTSLPASSLASSYITRQSVSQPHASMPKQRLICMLFFPLHSSCVYDREVHWTIRCACILKPNASNNKAHRIKIHRCVCQFLPRDHGGFGHKNQKMSGFLGIAQKVRHFLILVPKTAMISGQKLSNISMELNAASFVVTSIGL